MTTSLVQLAVLIDVIGWTFGMAIAFTRLTTVPQRSSVIWLAAGFWTTLGWMWPAWATYLMFHPRSLDAKKS